MEQTMSSDKYGSDGLYKTADLYYAAYLKTAAVEFMGTEKEGDRTVFVFVKPDNIRDLKNQYFTRKAKVPALTYGDEIKVLKTLTHMED
jgi:hypothetical protein